ncbi:hypothetical protein DPSP01_004093 [Paraphaeosphaeria sporulosa]
MARAGNIGDDIVCLGGVWPTREVQAAASRGWHADLGARGGWDGLLMAPPSDLAPTTALGAGQPRALPQPTGADHAAQAGCSEQASCYCGKIPREIAAADGRERSAAGPNKLHID